MSMGAIHCRKATEEEVNLFAAEGDVAGQAQNSPVQNDGVPIFV